MPSRTTHTRSKFITFCGQPIRFCISSAPQRCININIAVSRLRDPDRSDRKHPHGLNSTHTVVSTGGCYHQHTRYQEPWGGNAHLPTSRAKFTHLEQHTQRRGRGTVLFEGVRHEPEELAIPHGRREHGGICAHNLWDISGASGRGSASRRCPLAHWLRRSQTSYARHTKATPPNSLHQLYRTAYCCHPHS